jgi:ribose transport system substrate-binding protein
MKILAAHLKRCKMSARGRKENMLSSSTKKYASLLSPIALMVGFLDATAPASAAPKDKVTVSVVLALAAGEWSTEIIAGANAAAKDLNGKVNIRVTGPTTFDPQRQAQMFLAELETKPDALVVVNVAPPLFIQPALEAQARGAKIVWINVPPMPDIKNTLFVASDAFAMGQAGGEIIVSELEKMHGKPAAEITGDVVSAVEVPGLSVLENRLAGQVAYLKKKMPKINVLSEFDSKPDRERNFALWDQAIRKSPNALVYLDTGEEGEENIPKILDTDKIKRPFVSCDTPEEVRDDIAQGLITAATPANFFGQAYLAVYIAAQSILNDKPVPVGWVKVPFVVVDKSNIGAYQKAWEKPETGLRSFYAKEVEAVRDNVPADLPDPDLYTHPAQ